ncbi:MAG: pyrroline-5-carboxylate reductase [Methyloligellaceae bacterium]
MTLAPGGPLLLVGAGKMGGAMLQGWLKQGLDPTHVVIRDPSPAPEITALAQREGITVTDAGWPGEAPPAAVVLAVKPQVMDDVLPPLKALIGENTVVLSIAAGKTIASIAAPLGPDVAIVRAMPNTPAAIGQGISAACASATVSEGQKRVCEDLLAAVGEVVWVDQEALLDPVTAVSGSGPAYVFLLAECLADAGVATGLERGLAMKLACATVAGAGALLRESGLDPATLRQNVTSPGGTTEAALEILMGEGGLPDLLKRAVARAAERSRELAS